MTALGQTLHFDHVPRTSAPDNGHRRTDPVGPFSAKIRHGQDSALYFLHRKSSFRSAGFQYTHGNALGVEGSFSFKDAYLPLPNLVELQGDVLS